MRNVFRHGLAGLFVLLPVAAFAQAGIAGAVRDASGALIPGVTVEASSGALIEKTRTVVTDSNGQYKILDLAPGTYQVQFSLSGFKTVQRPGIVLEGTFTAQVNGLLEVGTLEETITVTGASPAVDVVNNITQFVANRDILDSIPTAARNTPSRALLIPGTTVVPFVLGQFNMTVHGSATSDLVIAIDGMRVNNLCGSGQYSGFYMNDASVQEVTYTTGAESAEMQSGGLRINSTPKDGGNTFSGTFYAYGVSGALQADNRSDEVKPFIQTQPGVDYLYELNPSVGGPILRDKLWFYFTYKYADQKTWVAGARFADGSPAYRQFMGNYSAVTRLTWQATTRDKLRVYLERQYNGEFYNGFNTLPTTSPEASTDAFGGGWVPQLKWTQATSNRLMLEAGISYYNQPYEQNYRPEVGPTALPQLESTTNRLTGAAGYLIPTYTSKTTDYNAMASASYITGSHAIKAGMTTLWGTNSRTFTSHAEINTLIFSNGNPLAVAVANTPATAMQKVKNDLGLYVQDTWTVDRITLNLGARFDHFNAEVPAHSSGAGTWIAARNFAAIEDVPNWNDWSVRTGVSYDLFGTGKTALKANASKYIASAAAGYAAIFNGMTYATQTRGWFDADRNRSIFDASGNIQFGEVLGGTTNFGQITSRPDLDLARGHNWEYGASVQHELFPRVSVTAGYYRRQFYNLDVTDNVNLAHTDWNPFSITTPNDPRLPTAGQPIGMYSLNTTKIGTPTDNLRTYSTVNSTTYNGFEASANLRLSDLLMFGGVTTDRRVSTDCDGSTNTAGLSARDNPNSLRFCDAGPPFRTTVKASAAYRLPYDIQASGTFISVPGPSINATYSVTAGVAGRPVFGTTGGQNFVNVNLVQPSTVFLDYRNQLDARLAKTFRFDRYRIQGFMDVFNLLNAGTVLRVNETYGSNPATNAWRVPLTIMEGRTLRFGVQMSF